MADRYFAPDLDELTEEYHLTGAEAHHLMTVCRGKVGTLVTLFNGRGLRADATIVTAGKREALLGVQERKTSPPPRPFTIAVALPKGDRALWMIEKCTELNVARLVPLKTDRSVTHPRDAKIDRLQRAMIESCKQSGRDHLMQIDAMMPLREALMQPAETRLFFDVAGTPLSLTVERKPDIVVVGPEGGWTDEERRFAEEQGWERVTWPGNILRIETAAVVAALVGTAS